LVTLALAFGGGLAVAPSAVGAEHELFESKNAGRSVPAFDVPLNGEVVPNKNTNYIESRDGALWDGDERLKFVGYNSPNYAFLEDPNWHAIDDWEIEDLVKSVAQSNSKVVRVYSMGFQILPSYNGNANWTERGASLTQAPKHIGWNPAAPKVETTHPAPASYTAGDYFLYEPVWEKVDRFLATANAYGVRVIFPFINEWDWFGGRGAFANYYGLNNQGANFYGTNANSLFMGEMYDRLTGMIMDRTNTVTGLTYREDPAVMAWETSNEFTGADSQWTINRGIHLHDEKNINQLFMDGTYTQGAQGASQMNAYRVRADSEYVDIMNDHFYANTVPNFVAAMVPLAQIAKAAGKPYLVGEYGLTSADEIDHMLRAVLEHDVDGALIWSLRYRDARGGYYWHRDDQSGYNLNFNSYHWPGFPENSSFEENRVVDTLYHYSYAINGQESVPPPVPDSPPLLFDITSPSVINWRGTTGANSYDVERATSPTGPWATVGRDLTDSMSVVREGPLFRDVTTEDGRSYYYRVRGRNVKNPAGHSPWSNVVGPVQGDSVSFGANVAAELDPGFEDGDVIAPWAADSTTPGLSYRSGGVGANVGVAEYSSEDKHSGERSVKLTGTGELWFKTPVSPRNSYVASFWMKTTSNATKYTVLSREYKAGEGNGYGDVDPYEYRGPGPSGPNNVLAFSDYNSRAILPTLDKEFRNSISDIATINDGEWHYYTVTFNGGDLDIAKGVTEANLVFSNRVAGTTIHVDDINIHETLLANNGFTAWGVRWDAPEPWKFRSLTTSNNASLTALLDPVAGTGKALSQNVRVRPHTDYSATFFANNSSDGVKFGVSGEDGEFILAPRDVPRSSGLRPSTYVFNSGDSEFVTVAFYDAVKSSGTFRVDEIDVIPTAHATNAPPPVATELPDAVGPGWSVLPGGSFAVDATDSGSEFRRSVAVTPDTDYYVRFQASSAQGGVTYFVTDGSGQSEVYTTSASGRITEYAVPFRTDADASHLSLVVQDTAASGTHTFTDVAFLSSVPDVTDLTAIENGESTLGAQNLFEAQWQTEGMSLALDPLYAASGMNGVRVDYSPGSRATRFFTEPRDLSGHDRLMLWLGSTEGSTGTALLTLEDVDGREATWQFALSSVGGYYYEPFPAGFDRSAVTRAELSVHGGRGGTFYFDDIAAGSPFVVESGDGPSAWLRTMGRPGENLATGRTASSTISTGSAAAEGIDGATARSVTYSYNNGSNRSIKTHSQIGRTLGAADWRAREALQLWVKRGAVTPDSDTKMAVRLYLSNEQYAEAPLLLNEVAEDGQIVTVPFTDFTVYPTRTAFDPSASSVHSASLVFSQDGLFVADVPTVGNATIGSPVVNDVVFLDDVQSVSSGFAALTARPSDSAVTLRYSEPDFFGYSGVTVDALVDGEVVASVEAAPGEGEVVVDGLANGVEHSFVLRAMRGAEVNGTASIDVIPGGGLALAAPQYVTSGEGFTTVVSLDGFSGPVFEGSVTLALDGDHMTPVSATSRVAGIAITGTSIDEGSITVNFAATDDDGYTGTGDILDVVFATSAGATSAISTPLVGDAAVSVTVDEPAQPVSTQSATVTVVVDNAALVAAIDAATDRYESAPLSDYPAAAFTALARAITSARAVASDPLSNAAAITGAISALKTAVATFTSSKFVAPKVTKHPVTAKARLGASVTLTAAASGSPSPTAQWQRRAKGSTVWQNVAGATGTSLKVKAAKAVDGSAYRVVFSSPAGTATTNAASVTIVRVKPKITAQPKSSSKVKPGKTVKFTVKATGYPAPKVTWQRQKAGSKKWTKVKGATGKTLRVVANHATHGSKYRAVVSNAAGKTTSKAAKLTVVMGKAKFVAQPKNQKVKVGKSATFTATVAARPAARLQWYVKAPGKRTWSKVAGARKATLKVKATQARHGSRYYLSATNSKGTSKSKQVMLKTVR